MGIVAAFVVWLAVTAALIRRPRRGAGTFALCVMAVLWTAVFATVLAAALTHFGVFAVEDGSLKAAELTVPYIGRIAELIDYPVMWAVTAASLAVGIAAFAVAAIRGTAHKDALCVPADSASAEAAAAADEQTIATEPTAADEQTIATEPTAADEQTIVTEPTAADEQTIATEPTAADEQIAKQAAVANEAVLNAEEIAGASGQLGAARSAGRTGGETRETAFTVIGTAAEGEGKGGKAQSAERARGRAVGAAAGGAEGSDRDKCAPGRDEGVLEAREGTALVTRKYVLLNRGNVANMFNEYLNSLSEQDKERLENSLNTIIIK